MDLNKESELSTENKIDKKTLKPERRAISSGKQAYLVASSLEEGNRERNKVNAKVVEKYNYGQPYSPSALRNAQEDWRNNFPTGFMAGIIDRVVPSAPQIIDAARYLTSATLKGSDQGLNDLSEKFRQTITQKCRQWDGWKDLIYNTSQENTLIGGCAWAWLDDDDPFPAFFRQDEFFLPDGTGQHARNVPCFSVKKDYLWHEAIEFIEGGKEESESAGWDVDAMVETLNAAAQKGQGDVKDDARNYEDIIREGNMGASYETGAKQIETYHLFVTEPETRKVTHYIIDRNNAHKVLFQKDDRFEKMEDCLTLFTLQPGNGKFYGSKGLGKLLINIHIALERSRNMLLDMVSFAGRMVLKTDPTKTQNIQMKLMHPFIMISGDGTFEKQTVQVDVQQYLLIDQKLTQDAEMSAGAYIPDPMSPSDGGETATAKRIDYSREQQAKVAFLARFWGHFGNGMSTIQRRLCSSSHKVAKEAQACFEEYGLTEQQVEELASMPAAEVVQDMTQVQNQQVSAVAQVYTNNPMVDQVELMRRNITAMATPQLADSLIIPEALDQTIQIEATRQQIMENSAIMSGESVPVSPRDNHEVHLKVLDQELSQSWPEIEQKAQQGSPDVPQLLDNLNAALIHATAHADAMEQVNPEAVKPIREKLAQAEAGLKELAQVFMDAQEQMNPQPEEPVEQMPQEPPKQPDPPKPPEPPKPLDPNKWFDLYSKAPDSIRREIETREWGFAPSDGVSKEDKPKEPNATASTD